MSLLLTLFMILSPFAGALSSSGGNVPKRTTIKVCQNKDCVKNCQLYDGGLMQVLADLIPDRCSASIEIESSGCLSQCSAGPNVCIKDNIGSDRIFNKVDGVEMAGAILDVGVDIDSPGVLMAAVDCMTRISKVTSPSKKVTLLDQVCSSLKKAQMDQTTAMAHALILRADAKLETVPSSEKIQEEALNDALRATEIDHMDGRAWRVVADAREVKGDVVGAMEALTNWANTTPSFTAKVKSELDRLAKSTKP